MARETRSSMTLNPVSCLLVIVMSGAAMSACGSDEEKRSGNGGEVGGTMNAGAGGGGAGSGGDTPDASSGGTGGAGNADATAAPDTATDDGPYPYQGLMGYQAVRYPAENPHEDAKAMLGKVLFWEEQIGEDDTMACGTCHRAAAGGSDPRAAESAAHIAGLDGVLDATPGLTSDDVRGAQGIRACTESGGVITYTDSSAGPQVTGRKPPTYLDAMFAADTFWDGRASRDFTDPMTGQVFTAVPDATTGLLVGFALESQAMEPPVSDKEMACAGQDWADIVAKLATVTALAKAKSVPADMEAFILANGRSYPAMFAAVYGDQLKTTPSAPSDEINTVRIAFAVATHERRLTSDQTPWDRWNAGENDAMTPNQLKGYELFMLQARCSNCHAPPLFTDLSYHFTGFHDPATDSGRQAITLASDDRDLGKMKTPTLRNVGLREAGGLLHQGEGAGHDLQSVMELYNTGGRVTEPAITGVPIDGFITPMNLTREEIDQIIDFMRNALTDPRVAAEEPPFDRPKLGTEL